MHCRMSVEYILLWNWVLNKYPVWHVDHIFFNSSITDFKKTILILYST